MCVCVLCVCVCVLCVCVCALPWDVHLCFPTAVPVYLDCGACLAGSSRELVVACQNEGGEGGFVLYTGDTPTPFLDAKVRQQSCSSRTESGLTYVRVLHMYVRMYVCTYVC